MITQDCGKKTAKQLITQDCDKKQQHNWLQKIVVKKTATQLITHDCGKTTHLITQDCLTNSNTID